MIITLADLDAMFPETKDGSLYSDLYKSVYGSRPRTITFASMQEFDEDFAYLSKKLDRKIAKDIVEQYNNFESFVERVRDTMQLVAGTNHKRAIDIIAGAEGCTAEELRFYGYEILEHELGLKYGSIKQFLSEVE